MLNEIEGNQAVHLHTLLKEAKQMMEGLNQTALELNTHIADLKLAGEENEP